MRMQHRTVNHSKHFVDPDTGVHTNTIEATWNGMKYNVPYPHRSEDYTPGHLWEFMWRRQHEGNLWHRLLAHCFAKCRYDSDTIMLPKGPPVILHDVFPLNETARLIYLEEAVIADENE